MTKNNSHDVVVIGAGIVGICCALALTEKGRKVLLIDRNKPGSGTSYGNAGVISPWSLVPQSMPGLWQKIPKWLLKSDGPIAIKPSYVFQLAPWVMRFLWQGRLERVQQISDAMTLLNHDNIELYQRLLKDCGQQELIRDSYYVHAFRDARLASLDGLEYVIRQSHGAQLDRIGSSELQALEPALSDEFTAAILIKGQARTLSPIEIARAFMKKFLNSGGEFRQASIRRLRTANNDNWTIETDDGDISAPKVVVAAGAWSRQLLRPLGIDVPIEAERGYHLSFPRPGIELNHSVMDMDLKIVASSMKEGLRAAGTAEFAGLDAPANNRRIASLLGCVRKMLPDLATEDAVDWMGARPSTPDSLPCLGTVPGHEGLYAAFGHGHYGLMMAPKTGEIISDLVLGKSSSLDLAPYNLNRFTS